MLLKLELIYLLVTSKAAAIVFSYSSECYDALLDDCYKVTDEFYIAQLTCLFLQQAILFYLQHSVFWKHLLPPLCR